MRMILSIVLVVFAWEVSSAQTQVPHTFSSGQPARASEVNANFDALEAAIEAAGANARWYVAEYDDVLQDYVEVDDVVLDTYIFNRMDTNGRSLVWVKLTNDHPRGLDWYPAVMTNGGISPGLQGLETNHAVLAYAPGSNCTGEPIAIIQRRWNGPMTSAHTDRSSFRFWTAFNHSTNSVYYVATGGGTTNADVYYDLWEYGYYDEALDESSGLWVHQNQSCKVNVHMATRPEYLLNSGGDIMAVDARLIANFDSFERSFVLIFR